MAITLTEKAARQIKNLTAKKGGVGLRLGIKKVGCSGLAYTFDLADKINEQDKTFESHDVKVIVDMETLQYLDGSVLDYVREGLQESFKFDNPNATAQCGCGESFTINPVKN
jgi:iron-sulfur cluster assembly protein